MSGQSFSAEDITCPQCGSVWTRGEYQEDCAVCGGGALSRACPLCDGVCGRQWQRQLIDSLDTGEAHWMGSCGMGGLT